MQKIVLIVGPTAVGKTSLALRLCRDIGGEIVSADSGQVYIGMDIGTGKTDLINGGVPFHLVGVVEPTSQFDVCKFIGLADAAISDILGRGLVPFVVGGTNFYINSLVYGICKAPSRSEEIRSELVDTLRRHGKEALYSILLEEDPLLAARLHPNDTSRIIRGIEVKRLSGRSLLELINTPRERRYSTLRVALNLQRELLYRKINERVDEMIKLGLVDEVRTLVSKYGTSPSPFKAIGYKEVIAYLNGEISLERAIYLIKRNTRRFAKRQLTWLRGEGDIEWFGPDEYDRIKKRVVDFVSKG